MAERTKKLCSLKEAISVVPDGARIAFSNFSVYQCPMAAVHEIIRAGIKDLTIVGVPTTPEPTDEELRILREEVDPNGLLLGAAK